jgi:predicted unusual protein kinase regulating ubiquinone biosynthesis (AarF/ABC1/UbiB family)
MRRGGRFWRVWRRAYVLWTLLSFGLSVYLQSRGWLGRKPDQSERLKRQAASLRKRLVRLGPTFIKMGQMLATRADLLPLDYIKELSLLQDNVPSFANEQALKIIEDESGRAPSELFAEMSEQPVASASLGQVYRALLPSGEAVAVKVQRPNLEENIKFDLDVLRWIGRWLDRYPNLFPGAEWLGAVDEFDRVIHEEMDYRREAASAEEFRRNFGDWRAIYIPRIYHDLSSAHVLVMEFIEGIKVTDLAALGAAGHDARRINELIYRAYFKQLLEDGFFHADPHPGNLLVMRDGRLAVFDFGMVGRISEELQRKMVEAFFHIYTRDVNAIVDDLVNLGFLAPEADVASFREVVAEVFARKLDLRLGEVRFKELTYDLAPIVYQHPITTPARFTYLIRAIMTLEGISIVMNPAFNFFDVARPYVREFLFKRESKKLRKMAVDSLRDVSTGRFDWGRLWSMAKMAYSLYVGDAR